MRGAVLLVLASLGVATVSSMLLWLLPKLFRRRPPSFREQLAALAPRPGKPFGPAGGIAEPTPMSSEAARAGSGNPSSEPARAAPRNPSSEPSRAAPRNPSSEPARAAPRNPSSEPSLARRGPSPGVPPETSPHEER